MVFVMHRGDVAEFAPLSLDARRVIAEHTQLDVKAVIPTRKFPKTTSGKVQRYKLVNAFLSGEFDDVLADVRAANRAARASSKETGAAVSLALEQELCDICNGVIKDFYVGRDDNLLEGNTSSMDLAEICAEVDERFPDVLDISDFLEYQTVSELAAFISCQVSLD